ACGLYRARLLRRSGYPPAERRGPTGEAEPGGVRLLLRHHSRAAGGARSRAAGPGHGGAQPCEPACCDRLSAARGATAAGRARAARQFGHAPPPLPGRRADRPACPHPRRPGGRSQPRRARPADRAHRGGLAAAHRGPPGAGIGLHSRALVRRDRAHPHRRGPRRQLRALTISPVDSWGILYRGSMDRAGISAENAVAVRIPRSTLRAQCRGLQNGSDERSTHMKLRSRLYLSAAAVGIAALFAAPSVPLNAQQSANPAVATGNDDIGGVVTGASGPEAGVWVIAETHDLAVRYIKIVVTDDQGRYVLPDLPKANYDVWVRGYGLVDSPKVKSEPGKQLNLTAVPAPDDKAAAQYYPAIYWYSMLEIPSADKFGPNSESGIPEKIKQTDWLNGMKNNGCVGCHQLGQLSTRTIPKFHLDRAKSHAEAWMLRIQSGQAGENMINIAAGELGGAPFKYFGDWTERIAKGELPFAKPTRPQGVERNIVVTLRDWHNDKQYLHDLIASDRRYPTVN